MPQRIKIDGPMDQHNTAQWAALCALASVSGQVMDKIIDVKSPEGLLVELRINGEEVDFVAIMNRLQEEAQRWSVMRAQEMLLERASVLQTTLNKLQAVAHDVEFEVKVGIRKLFPEVRLDDDDE